MRFYRIDLMKAVFEDEISMRRFMVLVRGLPYDSAFGHFYRDKTNRDAASYRPENLKP